MTTGLIQDEQLPYSTFDEQASTPTTPASGLVKVYVDASGNLCIVDDAGATTTLGAGLTNKYDATAAPTANDDTGDGYSPGSFWIDVTNDKAYVCLDASSGAAVWTETTQSGGSGGGTVALQSHTEFTSNVSVTATAEASADTVVTASAYTGDGSTPILIEFFSPACRPTSGGGFLRFYLYDGSSSIGQIGIDGSDNASDYSRVKLERRLTPSAASHTYSIRATVDTGTGTIYGGAGGSGNYVPGFIRISEDPTA